MARFNNILDGGSGKAGPLVLYKWRGLNCFRARPESYRDKKSEAQLKQRQKMKLVHGFLRSFKEELNTTFYEGDIGRTPYQAAISYNLKYGIGGEYPDQYIDCKTALIAKGEIPLPENIVLERNGDSGIISWDAAGAVKDKRRNDELFVFVLRNVNGYVERIDTYVNRSSGICVVDQLFLDGDENVMVWAVFINKKQREVSNSVCLTC
ncbi:DUF6266 family protein [Plebeiibacterium marinum]|uniref:DUF6266 family protein n=1 Tax=Plebeiibacterium marinum TaxID=2992111 RepID=A0AAE3MGR0_9BACT|nr:DUF6266 family protein [Plebeiobacterium marinum]MCW3807678.1 DUF6266 family protein [Plebeiobacterium marinum]